jgi:hypothetical protein
MKTSDCSRLKNVNDGPDGGDARILWRSAGSEQLAAIGITMPPWPGEDEALFVAGEWEPTVG